jgi:hypothetical protein
LDALVDRRLACRRMPQAEAGQVHNAVGVSRKLSCKSVVYRLISRLCTQNPRLRL